MRKILLTSALTLFGLAAVPASAMPVSPPSAAPASITQVAWGGRPGIDSRTLRTLNATPERRRAESNCRIGGDGEFPREVEWSSTTP